MEETLAQFIKLVGPDKAKAFIQSEMKNFQNARDARKCWPWLHHC